MLEISFCNLIKGILYDLSKIAEINETHCTYSKDWARIIMEHFRPICLCNVSYKIMTKILSARLRNVMEELINPCQCSFIPNRNIGDNIIIA